MFKYKKVLLFVNRAVYLLSAAMLMAGLALTATPPKPVEACHPVNVCDVPSYTTIQVMDDVLNTYLRNNTGDFVIDGNHPCTPPPPVCDPSKHEIVDPEHPDKCICEAGWEKNGNTCQPEVKVTICHATSSPTNPYNEITVSGNSLDNSGSWMNGHGKDPDDIWASFTLRDGTVVPAQGSQDTLNNHCVAPTPIDVCLVPGYSTVQIMPSALAAYLLANPDAFVIDAQNPCTPPIIYIPVCDVPTSIDGSYATINIAEGELATWLAAHTEDFSLAAGGNCGPTLIDVCIVPDYFVTQVDQIFVTAYLSSHTGSFVATTEHPCTAPTFDDVCDVPSYQIIQVESGSLGGYLVANPEDFEVTDDKPCEAQVPYCHYDVSANQWNQMTGYASALLKPDYVLATGESCPVKVPYCHYSADSDSWTEGTLYADQLTGSDFLLEYGALCPSKVEPSAQCVWPNGDGSVDAVFAYNNPNAGTVSIPVSADNDLSGSGAFLGGPQPTDFMTGANSNVFTLTFLDSKTVSWFIKSPSFANGITATAAATGPACQDDPKKELDPVILIDPYCYSVPGTLMQWSVENDNSVPFTVDSWTIDGTPQSAGFIAPVGESLLTTTALGTHTVDLYWGLVGHASLTYTIDSCSLPENMVNVCHVPVYTTDLMTEEEWNTLHAADEDDFLIDGSHPCTPPGGGGEVTSFVAPLPIPVTGAGGEIIPVTGADLTPFGNIWVFAGFGMFGFGLILSGLRKRLGL